MPTKLKHTNELMQETVLTYLPNHSAVPKRNVFSGQDGFCKSAERASILVENYLLTGILTRGLQFKPRENDIILVSSPACGQEMLGRVIAALVADSPNELITHFRTEDWTVPWIESRYFDSAQGDSINECNYFSTSRRVLRTQMAHSMLNPMRTATSQNNTKYVCLIRHPLDLRAAYFKYIRECYLVDDGAEEPDFSFDEFFPLADEFVSVPLGLCELGQQSADSYEQFVLDWVNRAKPANQVHVVFYEALVHSPKQEVERLAQFLGVKSSVVVVAAKLVESDHVEGVGGSFYASPASVRQISTYWEMKFSATGKKHLKTYESMFEHFNSGIAYPFPQKSLPKPVLNASSAAAAVAQPTLTSLAKPFMKMLNDKLDQARVALLQSSTAAQRDPITTANLSEEEWAKMAKANIVQQVTLVVDEDDEEEEQHVREMELEAKVLRMSLRQQGVSESIVRAVAVRADSLSEML